MTGVRNLAILATLAALLASCDEPAPPRGPLAKAQAEAAAARAATTPAAERKQPIRWNETSAAFEFRGQPLKAAKLWTFDGATDGFVMTGGEAGLSEKSGLQVVETAPDPILRSPSGLNIDGSVNTLVIVRLTRAAEGQSWSGVVHYATANHGESAEFMAQPLLGSAPAINETVILVYDMARLKRGGADWTQSIINQLRFDFEDLPGGEFLVRQVAVAANPDPAALVAAAGPAPTGPTLAAK